jgi:hypothetical protein
MLDFRDSSFVTRKTIYEPRYTKTRLESHQGDRYYGQNDAGNPEYR